jgi:general secretion pathway protein A
MSMYCAFFGLQEQPFNLTPDPRFLFLSQSHQEALGHLLYGIEERKGFIAITGEVGTGKTLLCRALLDRLGPRVRTALIFNSFLSDIELLRSINDDFGLPSGGTTRKELIDALNAFLLREFRDGHNAVLIIDEAQHLAPAVLEQIRMLSNLETEGGKLLQIVLVGQPELRPLLARPELRQLNQRIALRYHLRPFDRQETSAYISHRLLVAGSHGEIVFTPRALSAIYRATQGIPRRINLLCERALLSAYVQSTTRIDRGLIRQAVADLEGIENARPPRGNRVRSRRRRWVAEAAMVALALLAGAAWVGYRWPKPLGTLDVLLDKLPPATAPSSAAMQAEGLLPSDLAAEPPAATARAEAPPTAAQAVGQPANPPREAAAASATQHAADASSRLEGEVLLRALLWEYSRVRPATGEGVKAALAQVASTFGLEMLGLRTDLPRLKRFRLACLVEIAAAPPSSGLMILRATTPEGVELADASGEGRRLSDEAFVRLWSGRVYLFHRDDAAVKTILVQGQQGPQVRALQERLHELGYLSGQASGLFDGDTAEAVRRFQRDQALQVDGAAGPATKIVLSHLSGRAFDAAKRP